MLYKLGSKLPWTKTHLLHPCNICFVTRWFSVFLLHHPPGLLSYGQTNVVTGEQRDYQTNQGYTEQTKGLSNKKTDLRASRRNKYRRDTIDAFSSEVISYLICILLSFSIFSALKIFILHTMHPCNTPYQSEKIPKIDFSTNAWLTHLLTSLRTVRTNRVTGD